MKLIVAVVQDADVPAIVRRLVDEGFGATKLASTGGFLRQGNTTLLVGVEDERVPAALACIREACHRRRQRLPGAEKEVEVGGATVFMVKADHFERV